MIANFLGSAAQVAPLPKPKKINGSNNDEDEQLAITGGIEAHIAQLRQRRMETLMFQDDFDIEHDTEKDIFEAQLTSIRQKYEEAAREAAKYSK
jgi:hypothetical protein